MDADHATLTRIHAVSNSIGKYKYMLIMGRSVVYKIFSMTKV